MNDKSKRVKNRLWWEITFFVLGVGSGYYAFAFSESEAQRLHVLDSPIAGTVDGKYRITGEAYRTDGSDQILQSRLNSSNVVYYFLERKELVDGDWTPLTPLTESVPYFLRDDSGDVYVEQAKVVGAFSREVQRMNVRRREAMLMVAESATAIGDIRLQPDGTRNFIGDITPTRFYSDATNIFVLLAKYFAYINVFFFVVTLAADYRSSRYGRGVQAFVCLMVTFILGLSFELCLYQQSHALLLQDYQFVHQNLIAAEGKLPRNEWILGVDAYNHHIELLSNEADVFPNNLAITVFGLNVPKAIQR